MTSNCSTAKTAKTPVETAFDSRVTANCQNLTSPRRGVRKGFGSQVGGYGIRVTARKPNGRRWRLVVTKPKAWGGRAAADENQRATNPTAGKFAGKPERRPREGLVKAIADCRES